MRFKVALFTTLIFILLALSLYVVFNSTLMKRFLELEAQLANRNISRVEEAIDNLGQELASKAEEWGAWDDCYAHVKEKRPEFESSNLTFDALNQLNVSHFFLTNLNGQVIENRYVHMEDNSIEDIEKETQEIFLKIAANSIGAQEKTKGLVQIHNRYYIIAAAPVTNSAGDAPINGAVILSREFDDDTVKKIEGLTRLSLKVKTIKESRTDEHISNKINLLLKNKEHEIILTPNKLYGMGLITDYFGKPIRIITVAMDRELLARGIQTRNVITLYILGFTFVALALSLFFLNKTVLSPLYNIGQQTSLIGKSKNDSQRIEIAGDREITKLAFNINRMLDSLSIARNEIVLAQQDAESANLAKSMFISRVSHEIRNHAQGIIGINRMIVKQELTKTVKDLIQLGNAAADGLLNIVNEVLDFSKAESGNLTFENISYDIRKLLSEVMLVISARHQNKMNSEAADNCKLYCDVDAEVPWFLFGDPTKLKQILINLLGNSVKFTSEGHVGLCVKSKRSTGNNHVLTIVVEDTGIGIPENKIESIFDPFTQADASTERQYKGTGLGLAIVKSFVDGIGGAIRTESKLGQGTKFTLTLLQEEDVHKSNPLIAIANKLPKEITFVAEKTREIELAMTHLSQLKISVKQIEPDSETNLFELKDEELIVFNESALNIDFFLNFISQRVVDKPCKTIALLDPSSIELKENLDSKGLKYSIFSPILVDELLCTYTKGFTEEEQSTNKAKMSSKQKLNILVADDMPTNILILEDMLTEAGHKVTSVRDGNEIVELIKKSISNTESSEKFDLIITDITMNIMNGDEAAKLVREIENKSPNSKHIPIVAITGHAFKEELDKIKASGMDRVLPKPITPESLENVLEELFH